jgi:hypothetical protein
MMRFLLPLVVVSISLMACAPAAGAVNASGGANGRLEAGDPRLDSGEYFETYTYAGRAGDQLTISLTSTAIDPYLIVLDPFGEKVAEIDDSAGYGLDVVITVNLPVDGSYVIIATSAYPDEVGVYRITVSTGSELSPGNGRPAPVRSPGGAA